MPSEARKPSDLGAFFHDGKRLPAKLGSIHLPHKLHVRAATRVRRLGLKRSEYLRILLSNYFNGPSFGLPCASPPDKKLKRVSMQVSLPQQLRREGQKAADRWGLSFSEFMESLIVHDIEDKDADETLTIYPIRDKSAATARRR